MNTTRHPYRARPGSLAHNVITWLQENPGEELRRTDIAVKFGVSDSAVGGCLLHAKQQGGLVIATNAESQRVYRLPDLLTEEAAA